MDSLDVTNIKQFVILCNMKQQNKLMFNQIHIQPGKSVLTNSGALP